MCSTLLEIRQRRRKIPINYHSRAGQLQHIERHRDNCGHCCRDNSVSQTQFCITYCEVTFTFVSKFTYCLLKCYHCFPHQCMYDHHTICCCWAHNAHTTTNNNTRSTAAATAFPLATWPGGREGGIIIPSKDLEHHNKHLTAVFIYMSVISSGLPRRQSCGAGAAPTSHPLPLLQRTDNSKFKS